MPAKHIHIHIHDAGFSETDHPREDDGKFGTSGKAHNAVASKTGSKEKADADVKERHDDLVNNRGFKHEPEKANENTSGKHEHYSHANGSRASVTHHVDPISGRHAVSSYLNTHNKK